MAQLDLLTKYVMGSTPNIVNFVGYWEKTWWWCCRVSWWKNLVHIKKNEGIPSYLSKTKWESRLEENRSWFNDRELMDHDRDRDQIDKDY